MSLPVTGVAKAVRRGQSPSLQRAETRLGAHGGEVEIAFPAEDSGQDLAVPIPQPYSWRLSGDG